MKHLKNKWGGGAARLKLKAFTLAEVLITLGIIGVVAAMTLPALINNKQNKELEVLLIKIIQSCNKLC